MEIKEVLRMLEQMEKDIKSGDVMEMMISARVVLEAEPGMRTYLFSVNPEVANVLAILAIGYLYKVLPKNLFVNIFDKQKQEKYSMKKIKEMGLGKLFGLDDEKGGLG
jgi:hypothetical protein